MIKIANLAQAQTLIATLIAAQNEIEVVSNEIVSVKGADGKVIGKRIELVMTGNGVGDATRRYFLRENSSMASALREVNEIITFAPKKDRGSDTYTIHFGLNEAAVKYVPEVVKEDKPKLSKEEALARRLEGKRIKKMERLAAQLEAANAPEDNGESTEEQPEAQAA